MVGQALRPRKYDRYARVRKAWAAQLLPLTEQLEMHPADISQEEWANLLEQTYPVHPSVLIALPLLFRQLAQNERSLFAFLSSQEPWSLQDVLLTTKPAQKELPIYRLPHLYAYVEAALGASLFAHARGRRWAELAESLVRVPDLDAVAQEVLTAIGTLNALGQIHTLRASTSFVSFALRDTLDAPDVMSGLEQLRTR